MFFYAIYKARSLDSFRPSEISETIVKIGFQPTTDRAKISDRKSRITVRREDSAATRESATS